MKDTSKISKLGRNTKAIILVMVMLLLTTSFSTMADFSDDGESNTGGRDNDGNGEGDAPSDAPGEGEREVEVPEERAEELRKLNAESEEVSAGIRDLKDDLQELERERKELRGSDADGEEGNVEGRDEGTKKRLQEIGREWNAIKAKLEELHVKLKRIMTAIQEHEKENKERRERDEKERPGNSDGYNDDDYYDENGRPKTERPSDRDRYPGQDDRDRPGNDNGERPDPDRPQGERPDPERPYWERPHREEQDEDQSDREFTVEEKIRHLRHMILEYGKRINNLENRILTLEQKLLYVENEDARWKLEVGIGLLRGEIEGEWMKIDYLEEQIWELEEGEEPREPEYELFLEVETLYDYGEDDGFIVTFYAFFITGDGDERPACGHMVVVDDWRAGEINDDGWLEVRLEESGYHEAWIASDDGEALARVEFEIEYEPEPDPEPAELWVDYELFIPEGREDHAVEIIVYYGDAPAAQATVWLSNDESGHTNEHGIVYFDSLGPGEYVFEVVYGDMEACGEFYIEEEGTPELTVEYEVFNYQEQGYYLKIIARYGDSFAHGAEVILSNGATGVANQYGLVWFHYLEAGEYYATVGYEGSAVTMEIVVG